MRCSTIPLTCSTLATICLMLCGIASAQEESKWYPGSSNGLRDAPSKVEQTSSNDTGGRYGNTPGLKPLTSQPDITPIRSQNQNPQASAATKPAQIKKTIPAERRYGDSTKPNKAVSQANDFQTRLTALELAVSTVVSEEPNLWRFEPLELEATQLLILASNENERESVRQIAKRVENFSSLAQRYRNARLQIANNEPVSRPLQTNSVNQIASGKNEEASSEYDAIGVLRPVVSKRPGAPKYALVDKEGQITSFVTPKPGVDLQPMLGKRLGVRGSRGYIPEFQREHVTAERVAMINSGSIR